MTAFDALAERALAEGGPAFPGMSAGAATFALTASPAAERRSLAAGAASFAVAPQGAGLSAPSAAASFALSGQPVSYGGVMLAGAAGYVLSGGAAHIAIPSSGAAFALSRQGAGFGARFAAAAASYNLFARPVVMALDLSATAKSPMGAVAEYAVGEFPENETLALLALPASFAITGQALTYRPSLAADRGSFALSGHAAGIAFRSPAASFSLSGAALRFAPSLAAGAGAYTVALSPAQMAWAHDGASFALSGHALALSTALRVAAASYTLGLSAPFVGVRGDAGAFALAGQEATGRLVAPLPPAAYALNGQDVRFINAVNLYADAAAFAVSAQPANERRWMAAERGAFSFAASFLTAIGFPAGPAAFSVSGQAVLSRLGFQLAAGQFTLLGWSVTDAQGPSGDHIYLVEVQGHDGTQLVTYHLATEGFTSLPGDTPANTYYVPRISDPGNFERSLFSGEDIRGRSSVGAGDIVVASGDPGNGETLDAWLSHGWDGRPVTIRALPVGERSVSKASTLFRGRLKKLTATDPLNKFSLQIADRLSDLDKPLLTARFAGTTTGPGATAEGNADLKGTVKQRVYGEAYEVPLQPANPYDLIYLASDGGAAAISAVYDQGKALTAAADYATISALKAATTGGAGSGAAIEAGKYATCLAAGLVRLGGSPVGAVTADVVTGAAAADRTAAQVAKRMMLDFGVPLADIITGAFTALDGLNPATVGYLVADDRTALTAVQDVLDSVGGWMVPGRSGAFEVGRLEAPQPSAGLNFDLDAQALGDSLERVDGEIPVYRVILQYKRINRVQSAGEVAGSVTAERRAYLANEWRTVVAEDASVKVKHLNAREITIPTCLTSEAAAQAEANRQLAMLKVERERYSVTLPLSDGWPGDVGLAMTLRHPRLGFGAGKAFVILARLDDYARESVRFTLWG